MAGKIIIVALFTIFLIVAIAPRIIQKRRKVETMGCIGIDRRIFLVGKLSLFTSFIFILVQLFIVNLSLFEQKSIFYFAMVPLYAEEMNFKMDRGMEELLDKFDRHHIGDIIDPKRKNVCR